MVELSLAVEAFFIGKMINYKEYITSSKWAAVRNDAMILAGHKCEANGCDRDAAHVHHLRYDNLGFEEPEDLICLCAKHHMYEHGLVNLKKKKRKRPAKKKKLDKCYLCNEDINEEYAILNFKKHNISGKFHRKCARKFKKHMRKKEKNDSRTIIRRNGENIKI